MSYAIMDLETTIKKVFKRKASPFGGANSIVAVGFKCKDDPVNTGYYLPENPQPRWFTDLLKKCKLLVGFNIKFDILHCMQNPEFRQAWIEWIVDGGQLWDVQLAEYLLYGMDPAQHMLSLDEVAPRYGGSLKNDAVKALWDAGVDTLDIDRDLLMEYLLGAPEVDDDHGDIGNTEMCFRGQLAAFRARNGLNSALLNMGALVFTIEAEYNGMFIDRERGEELRAKLLIDLTAAEERLHAYVAHLPYEFKWTSPKQLSALIFGGDIAYETRQEKRDENGEYVYFQKEEEHVLLIDGTHKRADQLVEWDWGTQVQRFTSGKNKGMPKTKKVKVPDIERGPKIEKVEKVYSFPGYTQPEKKWESKSTPGVYSTASDIIAELGSRDIPFLKDLAARAKMSKDLGTYYYSEDEDSGERKGMMTLIGDDGLIHHQLNMVNTVTARLSSSDPNLQNIPKGDKSDVKSVFVSRFKGGKIVQSDFTSLEVYVQAILTMCRQLIEDLRSGLDMHCARAMTAWGKKHGVTYEYILEAAKDENHPEHKKWKKLRNIAKIFSFQRAYGAGVKKIAAFTGMPEEDIEALILAEAERYPEIDSFYEDLAEVVKRNRKPGKVFVPHPEVKGITCQLGRSHYTTPDGKVYSYREQPAPEYQVKRGTYQSFSPTEQRNYVVQGTGGEWAKAAMWLSVRAFYAKGNFGGRGLLVNQVHDAEYADAAGDVALDAAALLEACMLEASNFMEWYFNWPLPLGVPTETKYGDSMMEEHDLPACHPQRVAQYRAWVRETLIANHKPSYEV
jgi:DNA polymerase-1